MRRRVTVTAGLAAFAVALASFLFLSFRLEGAQSRVLAAARTIPAGQTLRADTSFLVGAGAPVQMTPTASVDTIQQSAYRSVNGAVALVTIPKGSLILRSELSFPDAANFSRLTLPLNSLPADVQIGGRVDMFAVSGSELGSAGTTSLCGIAGFGGCVVPLASALPVVAVQAATHSITVLVPRSQVPSWLLLAATQSIWAVPAPLSACDFGQQAVDSADAALRALQVHGAAERCSSG